MVSATTSWGQTEEVLTLLSQWLAASLTQAVPPPPGEGGEGQRSNVPPTGKGRKRAARGKVGINWEYRKFFITHTHTGEEGGR